MVNTVNINSLNQEKDLDSYFDKLLNQKMDKERTKIFEMELKENMKNNNLFPINSGENNKEINVNEIIKDIKQKENDKKKQKEINNIQNIEIKQSTEAKRKLLEQISSKDNQIFELKKELSDLKNKMITELNTRKTQSMLNGFTEKELKIKINELQNIINEKDSEIIELQTKYDNLKYNSKRIKSKLTLADVDYEENEIENGNNAAFVSQLKELQKTYREREEKLIKEKNDEIKKLRIRNKSLERESFLDNDKTMDSKKYLNEIKRLKNINANLEEDLKYYKELNNKYINNEKRNTIYESENIKLQNLLQKKKYLIQKIYYHKIN